MQILDDEEFETLYEDPTHEAQETPDDEAEELRAMPQEPGDDPLALQYHELSDFLHEIRLQPDWRSRANIEADYYDDKQATAELLEHLASLGIAWVPENLIKPTINAVLGLEAKTRQDWRVSPANDARWQDVADAINVKLSRAEKETRADRSQAMAYAGQVKAGLGWVEVSRNSDPFADSPYRVDYVHREEMFWDWIADKPDLADARYLIRRKRYHLDHLASALPDKAELLRSLAGGFDELSAFADTNSPMQRDLGLERSFSRGDDWLSVGDRRVMIYEVWYRRWKRSHVIKIVGTGTVAEFDESNPIHAALVQSGKAQLIEGVFPVMRVSWWAGPYRLFDMASPYKHKDFPYVPFWGFREDLTGVPYGVIRSMIPLQDSINARKSKLTWLLAARRIEMTAGATTQSLEELRREVSNPSALIVLDAQKMSLPGARFKVETDLGQASQQIPLLEQDRQQLKSVAGIYAAFEGQNSNASSGTAINSLVEQSNQSLGVLNDNFRFARQKVGELLVSLIIEDLGNSSEEIVIQTPGKQERRVVLNQVVDLGNGMTGLNNAVQQARVKVELSDVSTTASSRQQQLVQMTQMMQSLPPNIQGLLVDFYISLTDSPYRDAIVERLQTALKLPKDGDDSQMPKTPEDLQALVQQATQQAVAQAMQQVEVKFREAELAQADKKIAIEQFNAQTKRIEVEQIKAFDSQTKRIDVENNDEHQTLRTGIDAAGARSSFPQAPAIGATAANPFNPSNAAQR